MKLLRSIVFSTAVLLVLSNCGGNPDDVEAKKTKLSELRSQAAQLKTEISELEKEIVELDPDFGKSTRNVILVTTANVMPQHFEHKIEVRGTVESKKNVMISSETGGRIETIRVAEGQAVNKGESLITLDADIIKNNIEELKTALQLAETVFERQSNLWEKKIGSEIQYLEAKNNKESLERRLQTAYSQLSQSIVRAPFYGTIDEIPVKVGEMTIPGTPLLRLVNPNEMYIRADISEIYIGKFEKGEAVDVFFPSQKESINTTISSVGQVINRENRTFEVEIELPTVEFPIRPNQVTILKLKDYENKEALVVPTKLVQRDDKGTFIYGTEDADNSLTARKIHIETGMSFDSQTEVLTGLKNNDQIIDRGFRDVTEGTEIRVATAQK